MPKEKKEKKENLVLSNPTTQMTVMAVIVTTVVQPLVQIFHLREGVTILLALMVSFLCAYYHVRIVQELKKIESYIVIVLGTFVIFSTALGSNTLIGKDPQADKAGVTEQKIKNLEEQIKNKNDLLKALGVENVSSRADAGLQGEFLSQLPAPKDGTAGLPFLFREAFAQEVPAESSGSDADKKTDEEKKGTNKKDAIKQYREKQKKLQEEQEELQKRDSQQTEQGLWKKW